MVRTRPEDDYDPILLHHVKEHHGWHLVGTDDEDKGTASVFSFGIFDTLGDPETRMFGFGSTQRMGEIKSQDLSYRRANSGKQNDVFVR